MSTTILHLTDLHLGPGELRDEDLKQAVPQVERSRLIERLASYLQCIPKPDFVVISGDVTIAGGEQGFQDTLKWLTARIDEASLPAAERILITAGNHDVKWGVEEAPGWHVQRYRGFFEAFGRAFPHAYIPECDPALDSSKPAFTSKTGLIGGVSTKLDLGRVKIKASYPFLLDLEKNVLLFAFNSSLGCGVFVRTSPEVAKKWEAILKLSEKSELYDHLRSLHEAYRQSLLIDAGLVGNEQLDYFGKLMRRMRKELSITRFRELTKVAVLHHHIGTLWRQQLESKSFETVIDAAQPKQALVEFGFDLVLHGHKHKNHVGLDATVIPISSSKKLNPLCIVSGGTICGYPSLNDRQTFKVITLPSDSQSRSYASVAEVPLEATADPAAVISTSSALFKIPLSSHLPELHDLNILKQMLDEYLVQKYVIPVKETSGGVFIKGSVRLPRSNPQLASGDAEYECKLSLDAKSIKWFFEVILATKKVDFRQRARLYWLLTDASALARSKSYECRIVLIIGNLERTHFRETQSESEVTESIKKLRDWFQPALKCHLLTIQVHVFTQKEVDQIVARMAQKQAVTEV